MSSTMLETIKRRRREILAEKREIITRIKRNIEPFLWESGINTGPIGKSRPLRVFSFAKPYKIRNATEENLTKGFLAISENGIVVDFYFAALCWDFDCYSLEDLLLLLDLSDKMRDENWRAKHKLGDSK